jgi:DNA-binding winged helix-turn-helix (wHTH) protein/tetratricopeptide (TPR) repeat protein
MRYVFGDYAFDTERYELRHHEASVALRPKVYEVLEYLIAHRDRVVTKEEFLEHLWAEQFVGEAALSSCMMAARKAVGDSGRTQHTIKTVHGRGFRFIAHVEQYPHGEVEERVPAVSDAPSPALNASDSHAPLPAHGEPTRPMRQPLTSSCQQNAARAIKSHSPFIGRKQDLDQLMHFLREALTGTSRVVFIQGEVGIGKTRLLREFQDLAQQHDVQVCYGRCAEELALPYLPFIESLLSHLEHAGKEVTFPGEVDLEAIRWLCHPHDPTPLPTSAFSSTQNDRDKLRLFLAVSRATIALARRRPLVFILDDLHWADQASLELFQHLVFTAADTMAQGPLPLLITTTYRPPESSSQLARFITHFHHEAICESLDLVGFDESDIATYIQGMNLGRPSSQLIAMLNTATRGNPLFIQEILQYLLHTNALEERRGYLVTRVPPDNIQLPAHIAGALVAHLEALSHTARQTLILASFLGNRFALPLLSAVSEASEDEVLDALEEAMHQRLLLSEGEDFEFHHPLVRHVLYNAPSAARRQRLHYRLAHTLARVYAEQLDAHSMEIAHHLISAGPVAQAADVLTYARQAGEQALSTFAWTDAARYFEAALAAADTHGHISDADTARLHYRAGVAYQRASDAGLSMDHYDHAIQMYRRAGDIRGEAQALLDKTWTHLSCTGISYGTLIDVQPLHEALEAVGDCDLSLCGHLASMMAEIYCNAQQIDRAEEMARHAMDIGQHLEDDALCSRASSVQARVHIQGRKRVKEALQSWRVALEYARRSHDMWRQADPLSSISLGLTMLGQLDEAEALAREARTLSRTLQSWGHGSLVLASLTAINVIRGQVDLAEHHANESLVMASRSGFGTGSSYAYFSLAGAFSQRGAWEQAVAALAMQVEPGRLFADPSPALCLFVKVFGQLAIAHQGGQLDEDIPSLADQLARMGNPDAHPLAIACAMVEIGDFVSVPAIAAWGDQQLARAEQQEVVFTSGWVFLVPRILGILATLKQHWRAAETYFQTALSIASQTGAQSELARTYLDYARMVVAKGGACQAGQVGELVSRARPILDTLGMLPFTRRVQQLMDAHQL